MSGLLRFILISLWHGVLFAIAVLVAALLGKLGGLPIAACLQVHESIPTAAIFFGVLGAGGWLYSRFWPNDDRTIVYPQIWPWYPVFEVRPTARQLLRRTSKTKRVLANMSF